MRIYATPRSAARAYAGKRGICRVKNWSAYVDGLVRSGVIRMATADEHWRKNWSSGWVLEDNSEVEIPR